MGTSNGGRVIDMSYSQQAKEYVRDYFGQVDKDYFSRRLHSEEGDGRERNEFQKDYARVLYSSSFRRLQGKMQLLGVRSDQFFRNRLTHSLEVAQIARAIAYNLGYEESETYVVETCSLAHDLGNPPFGHYGEKVLHELAGEIGGFEGNAQTLRILMNLEKKKPGIPGLNLTLRTLMGVTKYLRVFDDDKCKKFIYRDDYDVLVEHIEKSGAVHRTIDVQIIDLSDEIAYAAHDLEDALSLNLFTVDELQYEFYLHHKSAYDILRNIITEANRVAYKGTTFNSSEEYAFLFRKELTSIIVNRLINDIDLIKVSEKHREKTGTTHEYELGFEKYGELAQGLKDITFRCINRSDIIQVYEKQGEKVIKGLFEVFYNESFNKNAFFLPVEYRPGFENENTRRRFIIDYISGMMDYFAINSYEKFYGKASLEKLFDKCVFNTNR